jgi:hypothetical protein
MKKALSSLVLSATAFLAGSAFVIPAMTALPVRGQDEPQAAQKSAAKANDHAAANAFDPATFNPRAEYIDRSRVKIRVELKNTAVGARPPTENGAAKAESEAGDGPTTELSATARVMLKPQTDVNACDLSLTFAGNLTAKQPPQFRTVERKVKAPFGLTAAQRFVMTLPRMERGKTMNFEIPVKVSGNGRGAVIATVSREQSDNSSLAFAEEGHALMYVANGKIYVDPTASTYEPLIQAHRQDVARKQPDARSQGFWIDQKLRFGGGEGRSAVVHRANPPSSSKTP